jgi:hypothetical protein
MMTARGTGALRRRSKAIFGISQRSYAGRHTVTFAIITAPLVALAPWGEAQAYQASFLGPPSSGGNGSFHPRVACANSCSMTTSGRKKRKSGREAGPPSRSL